MKCILLLYTVIFSLGIASGCDLTRKQKCIDAYKGAAEGLKKENVKCMKINDVRECVFIHAQCSADDANVAASDLANDLSLTCNKDPTWEKMGRCLTRFAECQQSYQKTESEVKDATKIKDTTKIDGVEDPTEMCKAIEAFQKCASTECEILPINYEMSRLMKRAGIENCKNIQFQICESFEQLETCLLTYNDAVKSLNVKENPEAKCRLVEAVEQCLRQKAKCVWEISRRILKELLTNLDCSQYGILCDQKKLEDCIVSYPKLDSCGKVKSFGECLTKNASCPADRLDNILTEVKDENRLDCDSPNGEEKAQCDCQKSPEL